MFKKFLLPFFVFIIVITSSVLGYVYFNQDDNKIELIEPIAAHHHFRMQIINNGEYIDFSQDKFQEPYVKGQCDNGLTETPIHFHDGIDQIVHIHWDKITGGQVLKYYGINLIGGQNDTIVYQPEENIIETELPIFGELIDASEDDNDYWIYTGGKDSFTQREVDEYLNQDLETFFDKKSKITLQREELDKINYNPFLPVMTHAHSDDEQIIKDEETGEVLQEPSQEELREIQSLIGDVVIFIQDVEPSDEQINERFDNLVMLENSVCGG